LDAESFFLFFENSLRAALPSADIVRIRSSSNWVDLSFTSVDHFITAVMSAAGANIRCEVFSTFKGRNQKHKPIESCILRLFVSRNCLDTRLAFFLYETVNIQSANDPPDELHRKQAPIKPYEDWLSSTDEP